MLKALVLYLIASICIASGAANAATKELTKAIFAVIPWDENEPDTETRKRFAVAIEAYWANFSARVPRLSPKEQEWIEGEMAAQGDRLNRAINSKEYALWSLNRHTDLCLDSIRNVARSFETEQSQQLEMFYWVKMINCYDGTNDLTIYLDRADLPYNDDADRHVQTPISNTTQQIIVNKVAPMAMAETMGWSFGN